MNVLAIAGSLRAASINAAFCRAAARLAPPGLSVVVHPGLGSLPLFNPDLEADPPRAVVDFRDQVGRADALLIASPEYAHGISGVMKNALDWLVSYEGFVAKPVAVVNTSPRASHAYESLLEVLKTMSADLVHEASVSLPLLGACTTEEQMVSTPHVAARIEQALLSLARACNCAVPGAPRSGIIDGLHAPIDKPFADRFAAEWIAAWNAHDLDAVLVHYDEDFEMSSPYIIQFEADPSGRLRGKSRVAAYWKKALGIVPDLRFELLSVLVGVDSVTIHYKGARGRTVAEVFHFAADRKVIRAFAHYAG
jgi:NAD(P)H-dependent FMN reductase